MLLISLAIHGVLLFTPTSFDSPKPEASPEAEQTVSLTQLPPDNQPAAQPSPPTRPTPRPRPSAVAPRVRQAAPPPLRRSAPPPVQAIAPSQVAAPSRPTPANSQLDADLVYPGSTAGSFGLPPAFDSRSRKTNDNVANVANYYESALAEKGYTVSPTEQSSTRTVYQVSKQGLTRYITLIPNPTGAGTTILVSEQPLPADLSDVQIEDGGVQTFFNDLPVPVVDPNGNRWQQVSEVEQLLSDPNAFYSDLGSSDGFVIEPTLRPGIRRAVVGVGQLPQDVFADISRKLEIAYYTVTTAGSYGGGDLYQVTREETNDRGEPTNVTGYLSIVPTATGQDTVVFIWEQRPPQ
jgi:hypothetical protein